MTPLQWSLPRRRGWFIGRTDIGSYMHRWVLETPWGALRLHHILRSDEGRALHDHPWWFRTFILRGRYTEVTASPTWWVLAGGLPERRRTYRAGSTRFIPADLAHRLELHDGPVWTLVVTGPKVREWGFHTAAGWLPWREARDFWAAS